MSQLKNGDLAKEKGSENSEPKKRANRFRRIFAQVRWCFNDGEDDLVQIIGLEL